MSSPATTPKGTPRRTPKRTPLQERSSSEKNEDASRVHRDGQPEMSDANIFTSTPFPTKPQHILLPSTIRKQRSRTNLENELPGFLAQQSSSVGTTIRSQEKVDERRTRRAPNLQLKRSVTALRDMYEAQAERSRPSTAAQSPALRPSTASSRMRSASSSDGMSGRNAWALLPIVSADDLATLPALSEATVQKINTQSSFASRMKSQAGNSSPNFRTYGSSSPRVPVFQDLSSSSDPVEPVSDPSGQSFSDPVELASDRGGQIFSEPLEAGTSSDAPPQSSPNFVRLGRSSSLDITDSSDPALEAIEESSPNVVRLGTSSPRRTSSPARSDASTVLRKRKRPEDDHAPDVGRTPLFGKRVGHFSQSPTRQIAPAASDASLPLTDDVTMPSSPPQMGSLHAVPMESSSPVIRMPGTERQSIDSSSMISTDTEPQNILSSSPMPPIHYPVVKAPTANQFQRLNLPKRKSEITYPSDNLRENRSSLSLPLHEEVPETPRPGSSRSIYTDDMVDDLDTDLVAPGHIYGPDSDLNGSQDLIISDADRHEATDELSALPRGARGYRPPTLIPTRSTSYLGTSSSSSQSRLNSLRTSTDLRFSSMMSLAQSAHSSMRSNILRPGSAGSAVVPTWARRYYSGFYRDSFQYLYHSSTNLASTTSLALQPSPVQRVSLQSERASSSPSGSGRISFRSIRNAFTNFIPSIAIPKNQQRLDVRKSHLTAGIGPLVSNPVHPPSVVIHRATPSYGSTIRRVSTPLPSVDPRAHWAGIVEEDEEDEMGEGTQPRYTSEYADSSRQPTSIQSRRPRVPLRSSLRLLRLPSPHLHHDHRLNTGSSASQGYGHPFNRKSHFLPPDVYEDNSRPTWFKTDLRSGQVICFMTGFIFPLMWFVGAILPLPQRPARYGDIEKAEIAARQSGVTEEMDIVAKLRFERHIRGIEEVNWQNARWWRRMNRMMCFVGFVVIVVVIVLAVIGTKSKW